MGPRFFNRGKWQPPKPTYTNPPASMGPRFFNRGKRCATVGGKSAVLQLQWGRGFSTAESTSRRDDSFTIVAASMGPRFFNRGKHRPRFVARSVRFSRSFNGAAVFQPRKGHARRPGQPCERLQWGRGFSTAERKIRAVNPMVLHASMGPRFFNRGKAQKGSRCTAAQIELQWGRGFQPRKEAFDSAQVAFTTAASMGPRFFNRGKAATLTPNWPRSNEAFCERRRLARTSLTTPRCIRFVTSFA